MCVHIYGNFGITLSYAWGIKIEMCNQQVAHIYLHLYTTPLTIKEALLHGDERLTRQ